MLNQTNQDKNELSPNEFKDEKTGLVFEKVTLNLPKNIVDYYRMLAHFQNPTELTLIENDIGEKLEADFEGRVGPDWKQIFRLYPALKKLTGTP
jgi:hypothetical protein